MKQKYRSYKQYLKSPEWQAKRKEVFDRALKNAKSNNRFGVCEKCGYEPYKPCLQLHHLSYEHVYEERLEELQLLCPRCHAEETKKQKEQKEKTFLENE